MNSRVELQWRLAAVLLIAVVLLGILAVTTRAQGAWVHGLIDADNRAGYKVRLERWVGVWEQRGWSMTNISGAWGIGAPMAGRYRARLEEMPAGAKMIGARYPGGINGRMSLANRSVEFSVPATGLVGDIVFIIAAAPTATPIVPTIVPSITPIVQLTATPWPTLPVPTTLYPPTVDPTATATPGGWTAPYAVISWYGNWSYGTDARAMPYSRKSQAPGPGFMQLSEMWQWAIIDKARQMQGAPIESLLDVRDDPLWLNGADMGLGAQLTPRFEIGPYEGMGFAQAIVVRER